MDMFISKQVAKLARIASSETGTPRGLHRVHISRQDNSEWVQVESTDGKAAVRMKVKDQEIEPTKPYPSIESVIPEGEPTVEIRIDAKLLSNVLNLAKEASTDGLVRLRYYGDDAPLVVVSEKDSWSLSASISNDFIGLVMLCKK